MPPRMKLSLSELRRGQRERQHLGHLVAPVPQISQWQYDVGLAHRSDVDELCKPAKVDEVSPDGTEYAITCQRWGLPV